MINYDMNNYVDDHLEKFVKLFVFLFEESLLSYHRALVDKTPKSGKWADLSSCLTRLVTTPTLLVSTAATQGAPVGITVSAPTVSSLVLPLLSLGVSNLGIRYNRKKLIKIVRVLDLYHQNEENKIKIRENLLGAAFEIFKSFEIKFQQTTVYGSYELALYKLARDAVDRMLNFFFFFLSPLTLDEDFFSSTNLTKAFILGKSKRYKNMFSIPHRYLGLRLDDGLSTKRLYEQTPVLKMVFQNENYRYEKIKARDISDFRLLFAWEEALLDPAVEWGVDDEIILFENRIYRKTTSFITDSLNTLKLANLTEEAFQGKKESLLNTINPSHEMLEGLSKKDLAVMEGSIKGEFRREIDKLEENITDVKQLVLSLAESLKEKSQESGVKQKVINRDNDELLYAPLLAMALDKAPFFAAPTSVSSQGLSEEESISPTRSISPHRCSGPLFFNEGSYLLQSGRHSSQNRDTFKEEGSSLGSHTSSLESAEKKQFIRPRTESPQEKPKIFSSQKGRASYLSDMLDTAASPTDDLADVLQAPPPNRVFHNQGETAFSVLYRN